MKSRDNNSLRGVILLAHGSSEPGAAGELKSLCDLLSGDRPGNRFEPAFLNHEPKLDAAANTLISLGCAAIRIFPLLVFKGKHVQEDIPNAVETLSRQHPNISFELEPYLFQMPGFKELILNELS